MRHLAGICVMIGTSFLMVPTSGCAIGKLTDAVDALEAAETQIDKLHVAECMGECSEAARTCTDEANHTCIDVCEVVNNTCKDEVDACEDAANVTCSIYTASLYYDCMDALKEQCDKDCDQEMSDCGQTCGDQLIDCLFENEEAIIEDNPNFSGCVADCVEEMQDTLKDIDL